MIQRQGAQTGCTIIEPEIILIPAGPVTLGVPDFPSNSKLPHPWHKKTVHVPAFGVGKCAVTVREYLVFGKCYAISEELLKDPRFQDPQAPAAYVSWIDAVRYTQWLARETGTAYRMLRDAEFEKAARGGLDGKRFPWGDESPDGRCDYNNPNGAPRPVGSFAPNGYGAFDMAGSIWSWCEETYEQVSPDRSKMCYEATLVRDTRLNPICRGGSFKSEDITVLNCAYRHEDPIDGRFNCIGFRVALDLPSS